MFIDHPLIKKETIERREFQEKIAKECLDESTLVVLPTGLGKTVIALIVIADLLQKSNGKILFLAPTKPLVDQHALFLSQNLTGREVTVFTGEVKPEDRGDIWENSQIIVSTPQVVENDIEAKRDRLDECSLIVFDEVHRAVGDYAYTEIADNYFERRPSPLVLGLTASPGHDIERIGQVCKNIGITNIAIRSEFDEDVAPYVHDIKVERILVDVPEETEEIIQLLQEILDEKIKTLRKYGLLDKKRSANTRDLLEAGNVLRARLDSGRKNFHIYNGLKIQATAIKVNHAIDLAKTQGSASLKNYINKIFKEAQNKEGARASTKELVKDARFEMVRRMQDTMEVEHPKLEKVDNIISKELSKNSNARIIVFTHYRDTCDQVTKRLEELEIARPVRFVGQANHDHGTGLKQKDQKRIIESFRKGEYNVLVATSVAEEGLDIPSTDLVVFFEPIPSEIRTIQRRGRTGRNRPGRVIVLLARDTKDESFLYSSRSKEKKMKSQLESLRRRMKVARSISFGTGIGVDVGRIIEESSRNQEIDKKVIAISKSQTLLSDFGALSSSGFRLLANFEKNIPVIEKLKDLGIVFEDREDLFEDFVIGNDVAIIRETVETFLNDIQRPDLQSRIEEIKLNFRRPLLIVEGSGGLAGEVAERLPVYDVLNSLIRNLRIPVMPTNDVSDTAAFVVSQVKAEMQSRKSGGSSADIDLSEYQRRMIRGLPNVTSVLAGRLLERFGTVQGVLSASKEDLLSVDGVGSVIADEILRVATDRFRPDGES